MTIKRKRIRNLDRYIRFIPTGQVIAGVVNPTAEVLKSIGFNELEVNGSTILPPPVGPVSLFNAEGKEIVHKDRPMETAYRTVEWHWTEWHGPERVEQSKFVDVPYQRYPRTFVPPPAVELTLTTDTSGNRVVVCPAIHDWNNNKAALIHSINLLLEVFGECSFFDGKMNQFIKAPLRRLNWRILPPGKRPWKSLKKDLESVISNVPKGNQVVIKYRLETINSYQPDFTAIGQGGFTGYIILGFPGKNLYLLESLLYGNATYVFGEEWEKLSKKTKAEILDQRLQTDRIIHVENWEERVVDWLSNPEFERNKND